MHSNRRLQLCTLCYCLMLAADRLTPSPANIYEAKRGLRESFYLEEQNICDREVEGMRSEKEEKRARVTGA